MIKLFVIKDVGDDNWALFFPNFLTPKLYGCLGHDYIDYGALSSFFAIFSLHNSTHVSLRSTKEIVF